MKRRSRLFGSVEEIVETYMPNYRLQSQSRTQDDPRAAGQELAERLMKTMRGEVKRALERKRPRRK